MFTDRSTPVLCLHLSMQNVIQYEQKKKKKMSVLNQLEMVSLQAPPPKVPRCLEHTTLQSRLVLEPGLSARTDISASKVLRSFVSESLHSL